MRNQLWGHALFLSSKMNPRIYSRVLTGCVDCFAVSFMLAYFLNAHICHVWQNIFILSCCRFTSTLASNDPLQTLFQLMSGRIPQASLVLISAPAPLLSWVLFIWPKQDEPEASKPSNGDGRWRAVQMEEPSLRQQFDRTRWNLLGPWSHGLFVQREQASNATKHQLGCIK